jgi:hypothetical protein
MKIFLFLLSMVLFCSFAPAESLPIDWSSGLILGILAGCYEVISRLIPTSTGWSIIGKVLEVLTWLSKLLDRKK